MNAIHSAMTRYFKAKTTTTEQSTAIDGPSPNELTVQQPVDLIDETDISTDGQPHRDDNAAPVKDLASQ